MAQSYPSLPPSGSMPLYEGPRAHPNPLPTPGSTQPHHSQHTGRASDTGRPANQALQQEQHHQQQQQQQDLQQQPPPPRPRLSCLHYEIARFAHALLPSDEHIAAVDAVMRAVQAAAGALWSNARAVLFGSQACGLNLPGSDLDVVLLNVLDDVETPMHLGSQRTHAISCLRSLGRALVKAGAITGFSVIYAKVPIIKTHVLVSKLPQPPAAPGVSPAPQLSNSGMTLPVDISIGALNGADAVPLMRQAVCALPQLRPLCLTVKAMLREAGLNEVFTGGLSSYSLFNMVYSHLQAEGFQPPELPITRRPATATAAAGNAAGVQGAGLQATTPQHQGARTPRPGKRQRQYVQQQQQQQQQLQYQQMKSMLQPHPSAGPTPPPQPIAVISQDPNQPGLPHSCAMHPALPPPSQEQQQPYAPYPSLTPPHQQQHASQQLQYPSPPPPSTAFQQEQLQLPRLEGPPGQSPTADGKQGGGMREVVRRAQLRDVHVSIALMEEFLAYARSNTAKGIESCGILAGQLSANDSLFTITTLIIPKQEGTTDTVTALNEEEVFDVQFSRELYPLGWIHTHPTQTCFLSSVDVHTHCGYQTMLEEAIAIVMAPNDRSKRCGLFRLSTPGGLQLVQRCTKRGFHPHPPTETKQDLYELCGHVYLNPQTKHEVIDLR
uniref:MPN domain-containing protein n=1 Tax=Dunaliella tertiolecta TaxID=3047 RepID=A0A6S8I4E8_DUNTE